jgi:hypothetical protein
MMFINGLVTGFKQKEVTKFQLSFNMLKERLLNMQLDKHPASMLMKNTDLKVSILVCMMQMVN